MTSTAGKAQGISGGTGTITFTYYAPYWVCRDATCVEEGAVQKVGYASATTQIPTRLAIVSGTSSTSSESSCTTGGLAGCGGTRTFTYQVMDQENPAQPIRVANMGFGDVICNTSTNQLNLQGYRTTCGGMTGSCWGTAGPCGQYTNASGQFHETLTLCAPACRSSGTCVTAGQTVATQTWTVAGYKLSSDVKNLSYQCNKVLVDGN